MNKTRLKLQMTKIISILENEVWPEVQEVAEGQFKPEAVDWAGDWWYFMHHQDVPEDAESIRDLLERHVAEFEMYRIYITKKSDGWYVDFVLGCYPALVQNNWLFGKDKNNLRICTEGDVDFDDGLYNLIEDVNSQIETPEYSIKIKLEEVL